MPRITEIMEAEALRESPGFNEAGAKCPGSQM